MGVHLLAQLLQLACQTSQQASVLDRKAPFEGSDAPESQTLSVPSADPDTILVPSGENATELMSPLWAFVFSLNSSSLAARQASRRQFRSRRGDFEGSGAPDSQTLIVRSSDPETILVPSGENATDLIQRLWASVFSLNSSSLAARQASRRQFWPRWSDLRTRGAPESQTLIVSSSDPDTILVPSGENATELMSPLWASIFSLNSSSLPARQSNRHQFWPRRSDFEGSGAPESQTLIVTSPSSSSKVSSNSSHEVTVMPLIDISVHPFS